MSHSSLELLASTWVPGDGPGDVRVLAAGLVNVSCRVARAGRTYLMRVAAADSEDLGLDREWECRVLGVAAAAQIAPTVAHCDPAHGILVAGWLSGRTWTAEQARAADNVDAMAGLLRRVHSLPIVEPPRIMNPRTWIRHYASALERRGAAAARFAGLADAADARLESLAAFAPVQRVLCHSDVHRFNVLVGDRLVLLDWEYAHVSDGFWDLAGWIANNDWAEEDAERLLCRYLERPPASAERARLRDMLWLYDYVCLLWSVLYSYQRPEEAGGKVAGRIELLEARLGTHDR